MGYSQAPQGYLVSGVSAAGAGKTVDARLMTNYAYLAVWAAAPSAIVRLEASHDATGWMTHSIYTATPTTATAQIGAYLPFVRANVVSVYSGGGNTGAVSVYFAPGLT